MRFGFEMGVTSRRRGAAAGPMTLESVVGPSLLALWDAERAETLTLDGVRVDGWRDVVGGKILSAAGADRPSMGGFGVGFAGAQMLDLAGMPFPLGSAPLELWLCVEQADAAFDAGVMAALGETIVGVLDVGEGPDLFLFTDDLVLSGRGFAGRHVARAVLGTETVRLDVDGVAGVAMAHPPSGTAGPLRLGADGATPAGSFLNGTINAVLVTTPLSDGQAAALTAMLMARLGA